MFTKLQRSCSAAGLFTVFAAHSAMGQGFTTLYQFQAGQDGLNPVAGVIYLNGMVYGTTLNGGIGSLSGGGVTNCFSLGCGTVFQVNARTGAETILHRFVAAADGSLPFSSPVAMKGQLLGVTEGGGTTGIGTVYTLTPGSTTEKVVLDFNVTNGAQPNATPVSVGGWLYGTAIAGGTGSKYQNCGVVYGVNPANGAHRVLYNFTCGMDGEHPYAGLIYEGGSFFGATDAGGGTGCFDGQGCGTVFQIDGRTGAEHILYRFHGTSDGQFPDSTLVYQSGFLYGVATNGGSASCGNGCGTIFRVNATTGAEATLYSFQGGLDGAYPDALVLHNGVFYGTASAGGNGAGCGGSGCGAIFSFDPVTGKEAVLYRFGTKIADLAPNGLFYANGAFYGTTQGAGLYGCASGACGTVFKFVP